MRLTEAISRIAHEARFAGSPMPVIRMDLWPLHDFRNAIESDLGARIYNQPVIDGFSYAGVRFLVEKPRVRVKAGRREIKPLEGVMFDGKWPVKERDEFPRKWYTAKDALLYDYVRYKTGEMN